MASLRRVAILGGGVGAMTAAFELSRPERKGAYEVTVYQQGWRLGGKGASSRNSKHAQRIEEHGLHLWMGCYENAFRVMRACYAELGRAPGTPLSSWQEAWKPQDRVVLMEKHRGGWVQWPQRFPIVDSLPGESRDLEHPADLVGGCIRWMIHLLFSPESESRWAPPADACRSGLFEPFLRGSRDLDVASGRLLGLLDRALALVGRLVGARTSIATRVAHLGIAQLLGAFRAALHLLPEAALADPGRSRAVITLDFIASNLIGILAEGLLVPRSGRVGDLAYADWLENLERIDHLDYRQWLRQHGAMERTVESCVIRGLGDAVFNTGHDGGAGTALNGLFRLNLTYRGSLFYRMQAGMGEVVFAPLYEVLKKRGVRFRFFHRVERLELDSGGQRVVAVEMTRQARVKGGDYRPLVDVPVGGGLLPCWPTEPDFTQLEGGTRLARSGLDFESLTPVPGEESVRVDDFDAVVLGISIGALGPLTEALSQRSDRWRRMLQEVKTTRTQAVQLWLDRPHAALGREGDPAVVTGYADDLDTWADMSHLIPSESWDGRAVALGYLCGSLDDEGPDEAQAARVDRDAKRWLREHFSLILPGILNGSGTDLDWGRLVDLEDRTGDARFLGQYRRANVHPSERYVLSVPGSSRHRLRADESGFSGLYLAGDWVRTGLNVGSVEAATMAGLRAAKAITGDDVLIVGDVR